ncbi:hypothetical protein FQA39_LY16887 [Lamprigera yunnana]|nr:hypothetical protein FQA39_LY16887 [Lamprigera yunnana]
MKPYGCLSQAYVMHQGRDGKSIESCLNMWREALGMVTSEIWKNNIRYTEDEIKKWCGRKVMFDQDDIAPIIINLNEDSDSESDVDI